METDNPPAIRPLASVGGEFNYDPLVNRVPRNVLKDNRPPPELGEGVGLMSRSL